MAIEGAFGVSLGLAVIFWVSGSLGKALSAAIPADFPSLMWRSELGFVAMTVVWWLIHPALIVGGAFWVPVILAVLVEVIAASLTWLIVRHQALSDLDDVMQLIRRLR